MVENKLLSIFQDFIYLLTSKFIFIHWVITSLCELEMSFKFSYNKNLKHKLDCQYYDNQIPPGLYCYNDFTCPYRATSKIAKFFFGYQSSGFCYYLNRGDFSIANPTMLLWDSCKECEENDEI